MTDLNYIPSLTYVPPAHSRVVGFTESPPVANLPPYAGVVPPAVPVKRTRGQEIAAKIFSYWEPRDCTPNRMGISFGGMQVNFDTPDPSQVAAARNVVANAIDAALGRAAGGSRDDCRETGRGMAIQK
jgi:hypothetical protein